MSTNANSYKDTLNLPRTAFDAEGEPDRPRAQDAGPLEGAGPV